MRRTCETCEWFIELAEGSEAGDCHGAPPSTVVTEDLAGRQQAQTLWPNVQRTDWCGAYRIAERLIPSLGRLGAEEAVRLMRRTPS